MIMILRPAWAQKNNGHFWAEPLCTGAPPHTHTPLEQNSSPGTLTYHCPQGSVDRELSTNECRASGSALGKLSLGSDEGENA